MAAATSPSRSTPAALSSDLDAWLAWRLDQDFPRDRERRYWRELTVRVPTSWSSRWAGSTFPRCAREAARRAGRERRRRVVVARGAATSASSTAASRSRRSRRVLTSLRVGAARAARRACAQVE
jgi:hypothetical protein